MMRKGSISLPRSFPSFVVSCKVVFVFLFIIKSAYTVVGVFIERSAAVGIKTFSAGLSGRVYLVNRFRSGTRVRLRG